MGAATANFLTLLFLSASLVALAWTMATRLTPEPEQPRIQRWLIFWCVKGMLLPSLVWALMNIGVSWNLQPFMPQVQAARHRGVPWVPDFLAVTASGLFIISSYWTAATLGWFVVRTAGVIKVQTRKDFKSLCWSCSLLLILPAALVLLLGGWPWAGIAAIVILGPIAAYSPPFIKPAKLPPIYARAIARLKFGKYTEAEWEIIRELEKCEDDFDGWLMLAELYATHFHDIGEAERTIRDICDHPKVTPSQLAVALHRLADWHLKLAQNPVAARRDLEMITERLKGTHLARMALLRMEQLPATADELRDQQNASTIPLPALGDQLDQPPDPPSSKIERKRAAQLANSCVERLKLSPNNVHVRERLARIFAEQMGRSDLAMEQIQLLLGMPDQPDSRRAEWLGLTAAWHLKYRHDPEAGRNALERLLREFPQTPQALAARRRLELMDREKAYGKQAGRGAT